MKDSVLAAAIALVVTTALLWPHLAAPKPPPAAPPLAPPASTSPIEASSASPPPADPVETPEVRPAGHWLSPTLAPLARVAEAEAAKLSVVKGLFAAAHVAFPPAALLLRAFKKEKRVELWAASRADAPLVPVTTYEVCRGSGELGPKRQEGDRQVPEGFYTLTDYSPTTPYYLAMLVSYPNDSDRILGDRHPGNEIMIHGRCASVGCLSMSDERIQEIYLAAVALRNAGGVVHVNIFPSRDMAGLLASDAFPEHHAFWRNLKEGLDQFEQGRRILRVTIDAKGRYHFR